VPLELLEPRETGETLVRMDLLVLLDVMVMLVLKDALAPLVIKDLLALLVRREILDLLAQSVVKDFRELVVLRVSPDPKDCQDLKDRLDPLVLLAKRVHVVSVESLVNLDLLEKLEAPD